MEKVELRGRDFKSKDALHDILKNKLELPEHYGANLDALWDCLTGWVDLPLQVEWKDFSMSQRFLGEYADRLLETFKQAEAEIEGFHLKVEN